MARTPTPNDRSSNVKNPKIPARNHHRRRATPPRGGDLLAKDSTTTSTAHVASTAGAVPADLIERLRRLRDTLLTGLVERDVAIRLALLGALAGEHLLMVGPPGTAKSVLARRLHLAFKDANYFERLLTKFSVPEELFGPFSIKGLEEDRYERQTERYLPTASVAFLDEIFKANSAILHALLTLLNEREFDNGSQRLRTPLISVIGASNELAGGEELDALFDRFLLRLHVGYVSDEGFRALLDLRGDAVPDVPAELRLAAADLAAVQAAAGRVAIPKDVIALLLSWRKWCAEQAIEVSDRRWRKVVNRDCDGDLPTLTLEVGAQAWIGPGEEARGGARVAALEGTGSFLVAAFLDSTVNTSAGAVFIVAGGVEGDHDTQQAIRPETASVSLGAGLDAADTDDDGAPEVVVGGTLYDGGRGVAWLLDGSTVAAGEDLTVPTDAVLGVYGTEVESYAGAGTGFVGDTDGDGIEDLAVTAPFATVEGEAQAGLLALFPSTDRGDFDIDDAPLRWEGDYAGAMLASRVFAAGDKDDDGYADILVSGQSGDVVLLLPGGGAGGAMREGWIFQIWAELEEGEIAPEPRMIGDVDGDGLLDLAMIDGQGGGWGGYECYIHTGLVLDPVRVVEDAHAHITGDGASPFFDAVDLGDRDGDGRAETLLTLPERIATGAPWFGVIESSELSVGVEISAFDLRLQGNSTRRGSNMGQRGALVGDVDGDGHDDVLLGGYSDDEGGENAGHAVVFSAPSGGGGA